MYLVLIDSVKVSYTENKSSMSVSSERVIFELGTQPHTPKPLENSEYDFQFATLKSCSLYARVL